MENVFIQMDLVSIKELSSQIYNGLQIYLAIRGNIQININSSQYILKSNDLVVVNCRDIYSICGDDTNIALVLKIPFEYMRRECEDMLQYTLNCYSGESSDLKFDEIRRLLIYMMMIYSHMDAGYRLSVRASLFQLLHFLLVNFRSEQPMMRQGMHGKKDSHIASVLDYIDENYRQSMTLEDLAKKEFMSVSYLSKLFKSQTGVGFLEYIGIKRLESAVTDLIYTEESILKIALQNGFANTKSFSDVFKRRYKDTPSQFRQRYRKKTTESVTSRYTSLSVDELDGVGELVKYLKLYEEKGEKNIKGELIDIEIAMDSDTETIEPYKKLLKIGSWSEALKYDVKEELELVQREIHFDYVYLKGIFGDGIFHYEANSPYSCYDYIQTVRFFKGIGLAPFIQIDMSDALRLFSTTEEACGVIEVFLTLMCRNFSTEYVDGWKLELRSGDRDEYAFNLEYFKRFYKTIKSISGNIGVGFSSEDIKKEMQSDVPDTDRDSLKAMLAQCAERGCVPDFITFTADPNTEINAIGMHADAYIQLRDFHVKTSAVLSAVLKEAGFSDIQLYLTDWNTLSGHNLLEAGSFYRAALIAETVLGLNGYIDGLAVWISEKVCEQVGVHGSNVLNLFHCMTAKRAIYYVLEACSRLGTQLIFSDGNTYATKNEHGDFVILLLNPCYFNPLYAMDYNFTRLQDKNLRISLKSLEKGSYSFKLFHYTMNFSFAINDKSSIHMLQDIEIYRYSDMDSLNYLSNIACPEFSTYEKEIEGEIEGRYTLLSALPLNAVALYIINKV